MNGECVYLENLTQKISRVKVSLQLFGAKTLRMRSRCLAESRSLSVTVANPRMIVLTAPKSFDPDVISRVVRIGGRKNVATVRGLLDQSGGLVPWAQQPGCSERQKAGRGGAGRGERSGGPEGGSRVAVQACLSSRGGGRRRRRRPRPLSNCRSAAACMQLLHVRTFCGLVGKHFSSSSSTAHRQQGRERQRERQTERQTDRERHRRSQRESERQTDRQTDR